VRMIIMDMAPSSSGTALSKASQLTPLAQRKAARAGHTGISEISNPLSFIRLLNSPRSFFMRSSRRERSRARTVRDLSSSSLRSLSTTKVAIIAATSSGGAPSKEPFRIASATSNG